MLRIRKPHDQYFRELIKKEVVYVENRGSGLYFCRSRKELDEIAGIRKNHRKPTDSWIMWRKKPIRVHKESAKYTHFI